MLHWMRRPFVVPLLMIVLVVGVLAERTAAAAPPYGPTRTSASERRTSVSAQRSARSTWFYDSELEDADEPDDSGEPFADTDFAPSTDREPPTFELHPPVIVFADPSGGLAPAPGFRRPLDRPP